MSLVILRIYRTHRARKELYIKAIEQEVPRLEACLHRALQDKEALADENRVLKLLLAQHGIPFPSSGTIAQFTQHGGIGHVIGSQAVSLPHQNTYCGLPPQMTEFNSCSPSQHQIRHEIDPSQRGLDVAFTDSHLWKAPMASVLQSGERLQNYHHVNFIALSKPINHVE